MFVWNKKSFFIHIEKTGSHYIYRFKFQCYKLSNFQEKKIYESPTRKWKIVIKRYWYIYTKSLNVPMWYHVINNYLIIKIIIVKKYLIKKKENKIKI